MELYDDVYYLETEKNGLEYEESRNLLHVLKNLFFFHMAR
jgi:hypothetical protein